MCWLPRVDGQASDTGLAEWEHRDCCLCEMVTGGHQRAARNVGSPCSHETMDRSLPPCNLEPGGRAEVLTWSLVHLFTHRDMANVAAGRADGSWQLDTSGRLWAEIQVTSLFLHCKAENLTELGTGPSGSGYTTNKA